MIRALDRPHALRICLLTPEYPPVTTYTGGIGTLFAALGPGLVALGHDVDVVTREDPGGGEASGGVRLHRVARRKLRRAWPLEDPLWAWAVERRIASLGQIDVVFAPEWGGHARFWTRRRRRPPFITNLTTSLQQIQTVAPEAPAARSLWLQHAFQRRAERTQTEASEGLIAPSRSILDWSRALWDLDGIPSALIPHMVDVDRILQLAAGPPPGGFPDRGPVVMFSGRLELRKGVDVLVKAMAQVWARRPEVQLVLAGGDLPRRGEMMSEHLRSLAGEHVAQLHLLGALQPEELMPALGAADVVALPSRWENFGLAALEALSLGLPLILTDAGGFAEIVRDGENGLLVPPEDAPALSAAILRLLDAPEERAALGANATRSAQEYAVEPICRRHAEFFAQIIASP